MYKIQEEDGRYLPELFGIFEFIRFGLSGNAGNYEDNVNSQRKRNLCILSHPKHIGSSILDISTVVPRLTTTSL